MSDRQPHDDQNRVVLLVAAVHGSERIPMPRVIEKVRRLYAEGVALYLWSSVGAEYAKRSAEELGIAECFTAFLPKPTLIDDPGSERLALLHARDPAAV